MKLRKDKRGVLGDVMSAPFLIIGFILVVGITIYMFAQYNTEIQSLDQVNNQAKTVSNEILTKNIQPLGLLLPVFLLALIIYTCFSAYFIADFTNFWFLIGLIILSFYTIIIGVTKVIFNQLMSTFIFTYTLNFMPFIQTYFDYIFIFQTLWYLIIWILYSLGNN